MSHGMIRIARIGLLLLLALTVAGMTAWGTLALYYQYPDSAARRIGLSGAFLFCGLATLVGLAQVRWRRRALGSYAVLFAALLLWWGTIEPSNDRNWKPEVAVLPYATMDSNLITVHNIRNFDYRSETDFTPVYYDKTFDLRELTSVDIVTSYWMGPDIAHVFLSFGFGGKDYLAISIERRDERGEGYSTIKGMFKQFETFYVVADERDVIRVRSNYRKDPPEQIYVYRVHGPLGNGRHLFLQYMHEINSLRETPEFYNTLTTNCTNTIWLHTRVNPGHLAYSWKLLLSGHVPEYLYEQGRLDTSLPFAELQRRSHINARAQAADQAEDFSLRIREGMPGDPSLNANAKNVFQAVP
ncbi:MAG: DUF4105 domain-containing protein [Gammaproteobacteria bacterium]